MSSAIPRTPSHSVVPRFRFRCRIHVQGPSVHPLALLGQDARPFSTVRAFQIQNGCVQVLSTTKAHLNSYRSYSLSCLLTPFGSFLSFFRGVGTPPPPPRSRMYSPPNPPLLAGPPSAPAAWYPDLGRGGVSGEEAGSSDLRHPALPYPSPPEAICAPLSHRQAPSSSLTLSRSLRSLST